MSFLTRFFKSSAPDVSKTLTKQGDLAESVLKNVDGVGSVTRKGDDVLESLLKQGDDTLDTTATVTGATTKLTETVTDAAKQSETLTQAARTVEKTADIVVKVDDTAEIAKISRSAERLTPTQFLSRYGKYIIGTTTIASIVIAAVAITNRINNTNYTITSIVKDPSNSSKVIISYTPEDMFTRRDTVIISDSNSTPMIDGEYQIEPIRPGGFKIQKTISSQGTSGKFRCITTISNQISNIITQTTLPVASTLAGVAGNVVGEVTGEVVKSSGISNFFSNIFSNVSSVSWISLVLCIVITLLFLLMIFIK